jgi:uncharacterized membrane protein
MKRSKKLFAAVVLLTIVAGVAVGVTSMRPRCTEVAGRALIDIPVSKLALGAIDFFCYHDSHGEQLRFILARDEAGKVHSVLDTCRQCGAFHKGYTASKYELICRLCGNRYKLNQIEAGKASCIPVGLATTQRNGVVEIKVSDLKQARQSF